MITIYHNNRCRKSREGLALVENSGKPHKVVKYLEDAPTAKELHQIIKLLNGTPMDLVRQNEAIWKTQFKGKNLTDSEIIEAMVADPKLIERPIVVYGNKAVIGRPPERILDII